MVLPSADVSPHMQFIAQTLANRPAPREQQLQLLVRLLCLGGQHAVPPSDRRDLHPLVVPLTKDSKSGAVTGLLYDMNADMSAQPPVVRTSGEGCGWAV